MYHSAFHYIIIICNIPSQWNSIYPINFNFLFFYSVHPDFWLCLFEALCTFPHILTYSNYMFEMGVVVHWGLFYLREVQGTFAFTLLVSSGFPILCKPLSKFPLLNSLWGVLTVSCQDPVWHTSFLVSQGSKTFLSFLIWALNPWMWSKEQNIMHIDPWIYCQLIFDKSA